MGDTFNDTTELFNKTFANVTDASPVEIDCAKLEHNFSDAYHYYYEHNPARHDLYEECRLFDDFEIFYKYGRYIEFYFITPLGLVGNILIIAILLLKKNRSFTTSVLFIGLAISDIMILLSRLHDMLMAFAEVEFESEVISFKAASYLMFTFTDISSWLLVAVALERVICVTYPNKHRSLCSVANARKVIAVLVVLFATLNVFRTLLCFDTLEFDIFQSTCKASLRNFLWDAEGPYDIAVTFAVPSIFMVITSIIIVVQLRRQLGATAGTINDRVNSVTLTLLVTNLAFVLFMGPCRLYRGNHDTNFLVFMVVILLEQMNPAANFVLYSLCSVRFRTDLIHVCKCCPGEPLRRRQTVLSVTDAV